MVHGDREIIAADDRDGVQWRATTSKVRRLLRRKITPRYETLYTVGVPQVPLRQATCGALMVMNYAPMPMVQNEVAAVAIVDLARQPFDGLSKRIAWVAIT